MTAWKWIAMSLLAVALGFLAWREQLLQPTLEPTSDLLLPRLSHEDLERIWIEFVGGSTLLERRRGPLFPEEQLALSVNQGTDRWMLGPEPYVPVDQAEVRRLVRQLAQLEIEHSFPLDPAEEEAAFGLFPPQLQLTLSFSAGLPVSVLFGSQNPQTGRRYVKKETSDSIALIPDEVFEQLHRSSFAFRLRQPLSVADQAVTAFEIVDGDGRTKGFERKPKEEWSVAGDRGIDRLDQDRIDELLAVILGIEASDFLDRVPVEVVLELQRRTALRLRLNLSIADVRLSSVEASLHELPPQLAYSRAGLTPGDFCVLRIVGSPILYLVDTKVIRPLFRPREAFLSRRPFSHLDEGAIERVRFRQKPTGEWRAIAERVRAAEIHDAIREMPVVSFLDEPVPSNKIRWVLAFAVGGGSGIELEVLEALEEGGGKGGSDAPYLAVMRSGLSGSRFVVIDGAWVERIEQILSDAEEEGNR